MSLWLMRAKVSSLLELLLRRRPPNLHPAWVLACPAAGLALHPAERRWLEVIMVPKEGWTWGDRKGFISAVSICIFIFLSCCCINCLRWVSNSAAAFEEHTKWFCQNMNDKKSPWCYQCLLRKAGMGGKKTPDSPQDVNYIQIVTKLTIYTRH